MVTQPVFCGGKFTWWRHQTELFYALLVLLRGFHRSTVDTTHKAQWRGVLMFSLTCAGNKRVRNNRDAGDLRRNVLIMTSLQWWQKVAAIKNLKSHSIAMWQSYYFRKVASDYSSNVMNMFKLVIYNLIVKSLRETWSDMMEPLLYSTQRNNYHICMSLTT